MTPEEPLPTVYDLGILGIHLVLIAVGVGAILFADVVIVDFALGFLGGVAYFSLNWRWRYGFWPD